MPMPDALHSQTHATDRLTTQQLVSELLNEPITRRKELVSYGVGKVNMPMSRILGTVTWARERLDEIAALNRNTSA